MPSNYQYVCKPSVSGSYKVTVRPYSEQEVIHERLVLVAEMCIMNQIAEDFAIRLTNIPFVSQNYRMHANSIQYRFNDVRRKINRQMLNKRIQEHFNESVCDIVDSLEKNTQWVENLMKGELINNVKYEFVDCVFCVGFLGGLVDILNTLHRKMYGKWCEEYDSVKESLCYIDDYVSSQLLNGEKKPKLNGISEALTKFFTLIHEESVKFVEKSKQERKMLCSKETITA
jgi:hypothetical protein